MSLASPSSCLHPVSCIPSSLLFPTRCLSFLCPSATSPCLSILPSSPRLSPLATHSPLMHRSPPSFRVSLPSPRYTLSPPPFLSPILIQASLCALTCALKFFNIPHGSAGSVRLLRFTLSFPSEASKQTGRLFCSVVVMFMLEGVRDSFVCFFFLLAFFCFVSSLYFEFCESHSLSGSLMLIMISKQYAMLFARCTPSSDSSKPED